MLLLMLLPLLLSELAGMRLTLATRPLRRMLITLVSQQSGRGELLRALRMLLVLSIQRRLGYSLGRGHSMRCVMRLCLRDLGVVLRVVGDLVRGLRGLRLRLDGSIFETRS